MYMNIRLLSIKKNTDGAGSEGKGLSGCNEPVRLDEPHIADRQDKLL